MSPPLHLRLQSRQGIGHDVFLGRDKEYVYKYLCVKIVREKNFCWFLLSTLEGTACITVLSFYANYAVEHRGVSQAVAAGLFTVFIYAGAVSSNVLLGTLNLLSLKGKYIASKLCALAGIGMILAAPSAAFFLAALGWYGYTFAMQGRLTNMSTLLFSAAVIVFLIGLISEQITNLTYRRDA